MDFEKKGSGRFRILLTAAVALGLLFPALPGLISGSPAIAEEAADWSPFMLWGETPVEIFWSLRLDPGSRGDGSEYIEGSAEIAAYPSTYPPQGLCTNYSGLGFQRQGTLADDRPWFPPTSTNFPYMITDDLAPSIADIELYIAAIEARIYQNQKYRVRILNDIDQVHGNGADPRLQIVVNHVINYGSNKEGHGCFTLYFPPYFNAFGAGGVDPLDTGETTAHQAAKILDPGPRYPILYQANGWGASNNRSFKSNGGGGSGAFFDNPVIGYFPNTVLDGYEYDGHGFVYVQSNGGGLGSVGYTREYLKDAAWMIDRLHTEFHCDRNRVVTVGSSRGGGVAIQVAVNPYAGQVDFPARYNVLGLFSRVPPLGAGTMSQTPITVDPTINALYNVVIGSAGSRYNNNPPPITDPAYVLGAPLATTDIDLANDLSPDGLLVENLRDKFIFFMHGTQDSWMSERHWLAFERKMSLRGVAHASVTVLNTGHALTSAVGPWQTVFADFVTSMMDDVAFDPSTYVPPGTAYGIFELARDYYWKGDLDQVTNWANVVQLPNQQTLPFSATIPYRIGRVVNNKPAGQNHEPGCIELHGAAGRDWRVEVYDDTGVLPDPWRVVLGTFGAVGQLNEFVETAYLCWGYEGLPRIDTAQYYDYRIWYEDQWGVMQEVSNFTNYESSPGNRLPPRTWVTETQPWPADPVAGYYPAWSLGGSAYMLSLGINWCETCPAE